MSLDEIKKGAIFSKDLEFSEPSYGFLLEEKGKYTFFRVSPESLIIWYGKLSAKAMADTLSRKGWEPHHEQVTIMKLFYPDR